MGESEQSIGGGGGGNRGLAIRCTHDEQASERASEGGDSDIGRSGLLTREEGCAKRGGERYGLIGLVD